MLLYLADISYLTHIGFADMTTLVTRLLSASSQLNDSEYILVRTAVLYKTVPYNSLV